MRQMYKVKVGAEPSIEYQKARLEIEFETENLDEIKKFQKIVNQLAVQQCKELRDLAKG